MRPRGEDVGRDYRHVPAVRALALLGMAGLLGCTKGPTTAECEAMLDHGVELAFRDRRPGATDLEIESEKARRRRQAPGRAAVEVCPSEVSQKALACAMGARHIDEYEKCLVVAPWGYR